MVFHPASQGAPQGHGAGPPLGQAERSWPRPMEVPRRFRCPRRCFICFYGGEWIDGIFEHRLMVFLNFDIFLGGSLVDVEWNFMDFNWI